MNNGTITQFPATRKDELIVKEIDGEVLIYDLRRDQAHCLNRTAGLVWKYCDGKKTVSEIARSVGDETQTLVDDRIIWLTLDELEKFHLLEDAPVKPAHLAGMNRRELTRNVGLAALAIPVIMSVASPTPAQTASSCAGGNNRGPLCPCANPNQCASNSCVSGSCA